MFRLNEKTLAELVELRKQLSESNDMLNAQNMDIKSKSLNEADEKQLMEYATLIQETNEKIEANNKGLNAIAAEIGKREEENNNIRLAIQKGEFEAPSTANKQAEHDNTVLASMDYVNAYAKSLKEGNANAVTEFLREQNVSEKTITTATTGNGNGGILIPTLIVQKIETKTQEIGGLLSKLKKVSIKGDIELPYEVSRSGAKSHTEGTNKDESTQEFATIKITTDFIYKKTRLTRKMEELDNGALASWLLEEMPEEIVKEIEKQLVSNPASSAIQGMTTADAKFVKTIAKSTTPDTVLEALTTVKNANIIFMNRADYITKIMTLKDNEGRKLDSVSYSLTAPAIHGIPVEFTDAISNGASIVTNGDNYTVNLPSGASAAISRDESEKSKNNTIIYLSEILIGGAYNRLDAAAYIDGTPAA